MSYRHHHANRFFTLFSVFLLLFEKSIHSFEEKTIPASDEQMYGTYGFSGFSGKWNNIHKASCKEEGYTDVNLIALTESEFITVGYFNLSLNEDEELNYFGININVSSDSDLNDNLYISEIGYYIREENSEEKYRNFHEQKIYWPNVPVGLDYTLYDTTLNSKRPSFNSTSELSVSFKIKCGPTDSKAMISCISVKYLLGKLKDRIDTEEDPQSTNLIPYENETSTNHSSLTLSIISCSILSIVFMGVCAHILYRKLGFVYSKRRAQNGFLGDECLKNQIIIGKGRFGEVYKCIFKDKYVAVKTLFSESEDIKKEFSILKSISHPNIIKVYDKSTLNIGNRSQSCLIMDYCDLGNSKAWFKLAHADNKVNLGLMQKILFDVGLALGYLKTKRILHRDIKPDNLLLSRSNNLYEFSLKLGDFGWSEYLKDLEYLKDDSCKIVEIYHPFEVVTEKKFSHKSDIWSMGVTMWELYTNLTPWDGISKQQHIESLESEKILPIVNIDSEFYKFVIIATLKKSPEDRTTLDDLLDRF